MYKKYSYFESGFKHPIIQIKANDRSGDYRLQFEQGKSYAFYGANISQAQAFRYYGNLPDNQILGNKLINNLGRNLLNLEKEALEIESSATMTASLKSKVLRHSEMERESNAFNIRVLDALSSLEQARFYDPQDLQNPASQEAMKMMEAKKAEMELEANECRRKIRQIQTVLTTTSSGKKQKQLMAELNWFTARNKQLTKGFVAGFKEGFKIPLQGCDLLRDGALKAVKNGCANAVHALDSELLSVKGGGAIEATRNNAVSGVAEAFNGVKVLIGELAYRMRNLFIRSQEHHLQQYRKEEDERMGQLVSERMAGLSNGTLLSSLNQKHVKSKATVETTPALSEAKEMQEVIAAHPNEEEGIELEPLLGHEEGEPLSHLSS